MAHPSDPNKKIIIRFFYHGFFSDRIEKWPEPLCLRMFSIQIKKISRILFFFFQTQHSRANAYMHARRIYTSARTKLCHCRHTFLIVHSVLYSAVYTYTLVISTNNTTRFPRYKINLRVYYKYVLFCSFFFFYTEQKILF